MNLRLRKIIIIVMIAAVFITANVMVIARWLEDNGIPLIAQKIREDFLTGTAITVIIALLILLIGPGSTRSAGFAAAAYCPVCRAGIAADDRYCRSCGSRV